MIIITKKLVKLPVRKKNSKKGDNGRVLIIGGSPEYIGAPALAGIAALRSGADSVIIAAPQKVAWLINKLSADLMTRKLRGDYLTQKNFKELKPLLKNTDCLLIGNGIAERPASMRLIKKVINQFKGLKVLDAAALFAFDKKTLANAILLPNPKEYQRLKKYCDINSLIKKGNIIVAKSANTMIYSKTQTFKNQTGNPGLTKAGTGDVLAGLTAGFVAQAKDLLQSAINAVYYLGLTGDILLKNKGGYFYLASDLAQEIKHIYEHS